MSFYSLERNKHVLKLEMSERTWWMDKNKVAGPFLYWDGSAGY